MRSFILFIIFILAIYNNFSQNIKELNKITPQEDFENIHVIPLHSDSNASSYLIFIKKFVKPHKHVFHTEHVQIISGKGKMTIDGKEQKVKKGDLIIIPEGSIHSVEVIGKKALKVLSVQSPEFKGKDRVFIE